MTPFYIANVYKWLKMAVIDAPHRFLLDVELEAMRLERNLSRAYCNENVENSE
jgi:hypothetical protein